MINILCSLVYLYPGYSFLHGLAPLSSEENGWCAQY